VESSQNQAGSAKARAPHEERPQASSRPVRFVVLLALISLVAWLLPASYILHPLKAEARTVELWGLVRAGPGGTPLSGAYVLSDKQLVVTDDYGCFRIEATKGAELVVEAPGYDPVRWEVRSSRPQIFLLFPSRSPR